MDVYLSLIAWSAQHTRHDSPPRPKNLSNHGYTCLFKIEHPGVWQAGEGRIKDGSWGNPTLSLLVQDDAKQRAMNLQSAVVVNEAKPSEPVHEEIHP